MGLDISESSKLPDFISGRGVAFQSIRKKGRSIVVIFVRFSDILRASEYFWSNEVPFHQSILSGLNVRKAFALSSKRRKRYNSNSNAFIILIAFGEQIHE